MRYFFRLTSALLVATVVIAEGAVSSGANSSASTPMTEGLSTPSSGRKPAVQRATLEGPITVGQPSPPADPRGVDLSAIGYVQEEFSPRAPLRRTPPMVTWAPTASGR